MEFDDSVDERGKLIDGGSSRPSGYQSHYKVVDCDQYVRMGFLRKVYGILSIQLLATVGVCALSMLLTSDKAIGNYKVLSLGSFIVSSSAFYWTTFILTFSLLIALMCYKNVYPINYTLLGIWTVAIASTVASACVITLCDPMVQSGSAIIPFSLAKGPVHLYSGGLFCAVGTPQYALGTNTVLLALAITAAVFVSLTAFTLQSKWDFSFLGAGLGVSLFLLIIWGLCMQLFGFGAQMQYLYSLAGALIFSLYIVFDTWKISCKYGPDDYIMGAIDLYLDILNLFLFILQLLSDKRR